MPKQKTQVEMLEDIFNKLDDFEWLIKCIATCHFDEFEVDQFSAAMNCFSRVIADVKHDVDKLITFVSSK